MWSKLRKNYRRAIAFMLIVAMTFTNVGTNLTIAFAAGEEENSLFLLSGDDIREAIEDAVDSGDVFDFASLSMKAKSKSLLTSYQKLIGGKQGAVYELDVEVDDRYAAEDTSLSVFYNAGTEDVVFLFVNESDMVMTFRANVDGYETARITVNPNTANVDTDEEDLSFAEDYSDTTMIDDETKKVTGEVVKPTETESGVSDETDSVPEKDTEISGENNAADENTDQSSEADSETEDVTEADKASEAETGAASETEASTEAETDSAPEIEKTTEAVPETETEAETEAASETEADEPDDAMDGELLGISNHKVFRVATSEIIDEEETPEAEDKAVVEEIPTTEPETEAATEASEEETKAEITEETSAPAEESSEAIEETTEPSKESSAAEESSAADETLTDNTVKDETGAPSDGNASNDTITPDASDDVNTSAPPISEEDGQLLEDDINGTIQLFGDLKGKAFNTVTIWDSANARAYRVALEDLKGAEEVEGTYHVDYSVDPVGSADIVGAYTVMEGEDLYFGVNPQVGYELTGVTANGAELEVIETADIASASDLSQYEYVYVVEAVEEDLEIVASLEEMDGMDHPEFSPEPYVSSDGVIITVHADEGIIPEGTKLEVTEVTAELADAVKEKVENDSAAENTPKMVTSVLAYDINLMLDGKKLNNTWSQGGENFVTVEFSGQRIREASREADQIQVATLETPTKTVEAALGGTEEIAVLNQVSADNIEVEADGKETFDVSGNFDLDKVEIEATHFSVYTVTFLKELTRKTLNVHLVDSEGRELEAGTNLLEFGLGEDAVPVTSFVEALITVEGTSYNFDRATLASDPGSIEIKQIKMISDTLVGLDSMGRETPIEDTLYFWYKAADTVPVSIYKDNQLIEKVFIPQGTINENSHVIDGLDFVEAKVGASPANYAQVYYGTIYWSYVGEGETIADVPAVKLGENDAIKLYYRTHIESYRINAEVKGAVSESSNKILQCPEKVDEGKGFSLLVGVARGYRVDVTVNGYSISESKNSDGIYEVTPTQAKPKSGSNAILVIVTYTKVATYDYWVVDKNLKNWHNADWNTYDENNKPTPSIGDPDNKTSYKAGEPFWFSVTTQKDSDWRMDSFQINGEDIRVPKTFDVGAKAETTLKTGTAVKIELTKKTKTNSNPRYTYTITVTNAYEDIRVTRGNFRGSTWPEVMPETIIGVGLETLDKNNKPGWDTVTVSGPLGNYNRNTLEFRYELQLGYDNAEVQYTLGPNGAPVYPQITEGEDGKKYFSVTNDNFNKVKLVFLTVRAHLQTYNIAYNSSETETGNLPKDLKAYNIVDNKLIYISNQIPFTEGKIFQGWKLGDNDRVYAPGDVINLEDVIKYAKETGTADRKSIELEAVWVSPEIAEYAPYAVYTYFEQADGSYEAADEPLISGMAPIHTTVGYFQNVAERTGYAFNPGKSNREVEVTTGTGVSEIKLYFDLIEYTITYHNVEDAIHSNRNSYNYLDQFQYGDATRKAYTFDGWYSDEAYTQKVTNLEKYTTGDKDLYAKWIPKEITITVTGHKTTVDYNGQPHTVEGFDVSDPRVQIKLVSASANKASVTQTNAGSYPMNLAPSDFEASSDEFLIIHINVVDGGLIINKSDIGSNITLETRDVRKVYDGQPLMPGIASAEDINGEDVKVEYSTDGRSWTENAADIAVEDVAEMTIQVRASGKNYTGYAKGTQSLIISKRPVSITGDGWTDIQPYTGNAYTTSGYTVEQFSEAEDRGLVAGHDLGGLNYRLSGTDVDTYTGAFTGTAVIMDGQKNVTDNYTITTASGSLTIVEGDIKGNIQLTTVNAGKVYDGQPLEAAAASATDIHGGTVLIEYSVDGIKWTTDNTSITITDAVDMTIQVRASGKNYDGYVTGEQKLVITRRPILITGTGWQEKQPYTGTAYTKTDYTVERFNGTKNSGLVIGQSVNEEDYSYRISGTNVGTYKGAFTGSVKILTADHKDVTENYIVTETAGSLEISQAPVEAFTGMVNLDDWTYGEIASEVTASVNGGDYALPTYTYKKAGEDDNTYAAEKPTQAGNYVVKATWAATDNCAEINATDPFTIKQRRVILESGGGEKPYDGIPLTNQTVGYAKGSLEFVNNEASFLATGSQTEVGDSKNTIEVTYAEGANPDNYNVSVNEGTLSVFTNTTGLTVSADDVTKIYDGNGYGVEAKASLVDAAIRYQDVNGNYTLETSPLFKDAGTYIVGFQATRTGYEPSTGRATVTISKRTVSLESGGGEKPYDGTPLTNQTVGYAEDSLEFVKGEASFAATGSQTEVGNSNNTIKVTYAEGVNENNYNVSRNEGILTVNRNETGLTVSANDVIVIYDGTSYGIKAVANIADAVILYQDDDGRYTLGKSPLYKDAGTYTVGFQAVRNGYKPSVGTAIVTINRRDVSLVSGGAEKPYDGTPLTNAEAGYTKDSLEFVKGEASFKAAGSQTEVGYSKNTIEVTYTEGAKPDNYNVARNEGTLTVTLNETGLTVLANNVAKIYDGNSYGVEAKANVADATVRYRDAEGNYTLEKSPLYKDAGTYRIEFQAVKDGYKPATGTATVTISQRNVVLESGDGEKPYDGTPLTNTAVGYMKDSLEFVKGEASFKAAGSQTEVGYSKNTIEVTYTEGANPNNYNVVRNEGTLTVTLNETGLTVLANNVAKIYDGNSYGVEAKASIADATVRYRDAEGNYTLERSPLYKDAGTYRIEFQAVKDGYKPATGTATVTISRRNVVLESGDGEKPYDGTPLTNASVGYMKDSLEFVKGEVEFKAVGSQTDVGYSKNTIEVTYIEGSKPDNYNVSRNEGTLTVNINKAGLTVSAKDVTETYNGNEYGVEAKASIADATIRYQDAEGNYTLETSPVYKDAGTYMIGFQATRTGYESSTGTAAITISKRKVTLKSGGGVKPYDGTPLTNEQVGYEEGSLEFVNNEAKFAAAGSQTEVGHSDNVIKVTYAENSNPENYDVILKEGSLIVNVNKTGLTVSAKDVIETYDGNSYGVEATANVADAIIRYQDAEGNYTLETSPLYKDAGTYMIGFQAMRTGYEPSTGTAAVIINKRAVSLESGGGEKPYDGTPLTNATVGYVKNSPEFVNGEANFTATGSQTEVGNSKNIIEVTYVKGANPANYNVTRNEGVLTVNINKADLTVSAKDVTETYSGNAYGVEAKASIADATVRYRDAEGNYTLETSPMYIDAGTYTIGFQATRTGYEPSTGTAAVIIGQRDVTLESGGGEKPYDGTPLTNATAGYAEGSLEFVNNEASFSATGSQTEVGNSKNTIEVTYSEGANPDNYNVIPNEGILTVNINKTDLTVGASNGGGVYNGTAYKLTDIGASIADATIEYKVGEADWSTEEPSQTNVGNQTVQVRASKEGYETTEPVTAMIEVTPQQINLTGATNEVIYNGSEQYAEGFTPITLTNPTATASVAEGKEAKAVGTDASDTPYMMGLTDADFRITNETTGEDITANYSITYVDGWLKINPVETEVIVTANDAKYIYDGAPHGKLTEGAPASIIGQLSNHSLGGITITGEETNAGTYENKLVPSELKLVDENGNDVTKNYTTITYVPGKLDIEKRDVTITAQPAEKFAGAADPAFTAVIDDNVVPGDNLAYTLARTNAGTEDGEKFGVYGDVIQVLVDDKSEVNANYNITVIPAAFTIWQDLLEVTKTITNAPAPGLGFAEGDEIRFNIKVTNAGNTTLNNITVEDQLADAEILPGEGYTVDANTAVIETMDPQTEVNVAARYVVKATDVGNPEFKNTAVVKSTETEGEGSTDPIPTTGLKVEKSVTNAGTAEGGLFQKDDTVNFDIKVTNTGTTAVTYFRVIDQLNGAEIQPGAGYDVENGYATVQHLAAGETIIIKVTYKVSEADLRKEHFTNIAVAEFTTPGGSKTEEGETPDIPKVDAERNWTVTKAVTNLPSRGSFRIGEDALFDITVTNTGNQTLENIKVTDILSGTMLIAKDGYTLNADGSATIASLRTGESVVLNAAYKVTRDDVRNKSFTNIAVAAIGTEEERGDTGAIATSTANGGGGGGGGGGDSSGPNDNGSTPSGGPGETTTTILPEDVPLASLPIDNMSNSTVVIEDEDVPLGALPKTGRTGANGLILLLSSMMLAAFAVTTRKKEDDN